VIRFSVVMPISVIVLGVLMLVNRTSIIPEEKPVAIQSGGSDSVAR